MSDADCQIANLIARYVEYMGDGNLGGVADLLAHAGVGIEGDAPLTRGRDKILALYRSTTRLNQDGTPRTKHLTTNLILEVDEEGGTASARSQWELRQAVPGLPLQTVLTGRYHDRFERVDNTWRFSERRYHVDLAGDAKLFGFSRRPGSP